MIYAQRSGSNDEVLSRDVYLYVAATSGLRRILEHSLQMHWRTWMMDLK